MTSPYTLIAEQWLQLHQEAVRVERFALSDPRTACLYGGAALRHRPDLKVPGAAV
jgi:hypothetical protein